MQLVNVRTSRLLMGVGLLIALAAMGLGLFGTIRGRSLPSVADNEQPFNTDPSIWP